MSKSSSPVRASAVAAVAATAAAAAAPAKPAAAVAVASTVSVSASTKDPKKQITVLVAVDASQIAKDALEYYLRHLHKDGNKLVLMHIVELTDITHSAETTRSPKEFEDSWGAAERRGRKLERLYTQFIRTKGVDTHVTFLMEVSSKPGHAIVQAVEEEVIGLVVLGTRGMGKICRTILGSVSDYVVHHAKCPVVVVR